MSDDECPRQLFIALLGILKVLSILALLMTIGCYGLLTKELIESNLSNLNKSLGIISSLGYSGMCIIFVIAEVGPKWFLKSMRVFDSWGVRGGCLGWVGIQTMYSMDMLVKSMSNTLPEDKQRIFNILRHVVSWTLIGFGLLYIILCLMCLRRICDIDRDDETRNHMLVDDIDDDSQYSNVGHKRSKEELELISNMAIALNMTSMEARKRFKGKSGTLLAKKISERKKASQNKNLPGDSASNYSPSSYILSDQHNSVEIYSPEDKLIDYNSDDNHKARRMKENDALEALYYSKGNNE
eukprot:Tbor_TRINITY_DN5648_c1_g5::TRINITY_DN5648_c1_g5_i1::g.8692::m.8692